MEWEPPGTRQNCTHYGVERINGEGTGITQDVVSDELDLNKMVPHQRRAFTAYNAIIDARIQSFSYPRYEHIEERYRSGCGW